MFAFHTPSLPPPLLLDLRHLEGGGSLPSQFYGSTHDNRDVYVRYRGGNLSVDIANAPGEEALDGTRVLDVMIGPPLDGTMSMHQFCRDFGVTINGATPIEIDSFADRYSDLTGRTTFAEAVRGWVTLPTSKRMLAACRDHFPAAFLVAPELDDRYHCKRLIEVAAETVMENAVWLVDGAARLADIDSRPERYILPKAGQMQMQITHDLWKHPPPKFSSWFLQQAQKDLGKVLIAAGSKGMLHADGLAYGTFRLLTEFATADTARRDQLESLGDRLLHFLPMTCVQKIDLRNNDVLLEQTVPLDPVVVEWCRADDNRWRSILREEGAVPWIGVRPKPA